MTSSSSVGFTLTGTCLNTQKPVTMKVWIDDPLLE